MNDWNLRNTLNWGYVGEYIEWLTTNQSDLRNLDLHSHWKNKMTDEEIEMRSHPNRSSRWIPNRIVEIRDKLRKELFLYVGHRIANQGKWGSNHGPCIVCGVTEEQIKEYIQDFKERIDYENKDELYRSQKAPLHFDTVKKRVLAEMSDYPSAVIEASEHYLPDLRTDYMGYGHSWDLCTHCYPIEMNKLTNMVLRDLNKVKPSLD
jgi:hypothetical protein